MYSINSDFVIKIGYAVLLAYVVNHMYIFTQRLTNISQNYMILILFLITLGLVYMTIKVGKSEIIGDDKLPSFLFITLAVLFIILSGTLLYTVMAISAFYIQTNF